MDHHEIDCPFREEIGGFRVLISRLEDDVKDLETTVERHNEIIAGIRGWTAGAAAVGALLGGLIIMLFQKIMGH